MVRKVTFRGEQKLAAAAVESGDSGGRGADEIPSVTLQSQLGCSLPSTLRTESPRQISHANNEDASFLNV